MTTNSRPSEGRCCPPRGVWPVTLSWVPSCKSGSGRSRGESVLRGSPPPEPPPRSDSGIYGCVLTLLMPELTPPSFSRLAGLTLLQAPLPEPQLRGVRTRVTPGGTFVTLCCNLSFPSPSFVVLFGLFVCCTCSLLSLTSQAEREDLRGIQYNCIA